MTGHLARDLRLDAAFNRIVRDEARVRQGGKCLYCREPLTAKTATREHRKPRKAGGSDHPSNIGASCHACNQAKGHMPEGAFVNLVKYPRPGAPNEIWLAWSRRRINLAFERAERRIAKFFGRDA